MSEGFLVDRGHANAKGLQEWVEGEPERSFWLGLRTRGREKYEVSTYRCDRCGFLESFALDPGK